MVLNDDKLDTQLHDYFMYVFGYKIDQYEKLMKHHIKLLSNELNVSEKKIIQILKTRDWCKIQSKGIFIKSYEIYIC